MKSALLVGINYTGTSSALRGCINDVKNMKKLLIDRGFDEANITVLTDKTDEKPTRANITHHLRALIAGGADTMFFHYSGHGTSVKDRNGDERDGRDEALCPLDYGRAGFILDDEIRQILGKAPSTAKVFCILDCCHSGSGCDLGYNIVKRRGQHIMARDNRYPDTNANIVMLSGCRDAQTSADAYLSGQPQGALTAMVLFSIQHIKVKNWEQLFITVNKSLKRCRFRQISNLSSGRPLDLKSAMYI